MDFNDITLPKKFIVSKYNNYYIWLGIILAFLIPIPLITVTITMKVPNYRDYFLFYGVSLVFWGLCAYLYRNLKFGTKELNITENYIEKICNNGNKIKIELTEITSIEKMNIQLGSAFLIISNNKEIEIETIFDQKSNSELLCIFYNHITKIFEKSINMNIDNSIKEYVSKLPKFFSIVNLFPVGIALALSIIYLNHILKTKNFNLSSILNLFMFISSGIYFIYLYIISLKKFIFSKEYLIIKTLFNSKKYFWSEITDIRYKYLVKENIAEAIITFKNVSVEKISFGRLSNGSRLLTVIKNNFEYSKRHEYNDEKLRDKNFFTMIHISHFIMLFIGVAIIVYFFIIKKYYTNSITQNLIALLFSIVLIFLSISGIIKFKKISDNTKKAYEKLYKED